MVVSGLQKPFEHNKVPDALQPFWLEDEEMHFYDAAWWKALWEKEKNIEVKEVFSLQRHAKAWDEWLESENPYAIRDREMMAAEGGNYFDTIGLVATVV